MELSGLEYRMLVEQAPILIWRSGLTGECDYFNERWLAFRGRTLEQEEGNGWTEGVHPDDYDRCMDVYLTAFRKRRVFQMEYRLQRYDGEFRWIFDRGVPFYRENGEFVGYIGSCIDVTDRIAAQEALDRERERQLKNLRGLLNVCWECKKIKTAYGTWEPLEFYILERSHTEFSHGLCPQCLQETRIRYGINEASQE